MIGLLQCDHVLAQFRPIAGDYGQFFHEWLPGEWRVYDVTAGEAPARLEECAAYVTTGSRASVCDDEPWIHQFAHLIRRLHAARVPFLGVCFGHQMMAHALGGRVSVNPHGWCVGVHEFVVSVPQPWMQPPLPRFRIPMSCRDQVLTLPPRARVLAANASCPVGMMQVDAMLGIQGHPEFPLPYAGALIRHRYELIGAASADPALHSLHQPVHAAELARWARRFLLGS